MKNYSKRYKKLLESNKKIKADSLEKIIDSVKVNANSKFVESIDLSFKINTKKIKLLSKDQILTEAGMEWSMPESHAIWK